MRGNAMGEFGDRDLVVYVVILWRVHRGLVSRVLYLVLVVCACLTVCVFVCALRHTYVKLARPPDGRVQCNIYAVLPPAWHAVRARAVLL